MADTKYCVNVWPQWCAHISTEYGEEVTPLKAISTQELSTKLCLFVFEVRKQNGEEFPPNLLLYLVAGIQRSGLKGDRSLTFLRTVVCLSQINRNIIISCCSLFNHQF